MRHVLVGLAQEDIMKTTIDKNCYCSTCKKEFHHLGIMRHRAMHRDRKENCTITFTSGITIFYKFED